MSYYLIKTIAGNEMRTLLRSWFFRIFTLLVIGGLSIFNVAMNLQSSGAPWMYRALASSIPLANLIILNLGQAIVAVFLASEFLKQDRKNDTIEVIYARSMTNTEYIFGKTLGILGVFFVLNLIVLFIGIGFSLLNSESTRNIFPFFAYPLLVSLPTLVFILGLSFFLMVLIKNQAVTFILLLGYIALTIFYLSSKAYHLFDYIAYQVPMTYSPMGGFGNMPEILLHRGIYFFAGVGFIFFTIFRLQRLPQSRRFHKLPLTMAVFFIGLSGFMMFSYYQWKQDRHLFKQQLVELNNRFSVRPKVTVSRCDLVLEHKGREISVQASLNITNLQQKAIDTLLFTLNPSLSLRSVSVNGKVSGFKRIIHLLEIPCSSKLNPGDSLQVILNYSGTINEDVCFIDRTADDVEDNFRFELFTIRKRFAFVEDHFVCLTSEALWYPTSGVGYATAKPFCYFPDFTKYTLKVKTLPGLTAISQGVAIQQGKGDFLFKTEEALPKINLIIGDYQSLHTTVDSITYCLYTFKGNQYYKPYFKELTDTLKGLIRDIKKDIETRAGKPYPFERFTLVEVPVHFVLDKHVWSQNSDAVQPEMVLYPEKGVFFKSSDFKVEKYRKERDLKRNNEEILPKEQQTQLFKQLIRDNLFAKASDWSPFRQLADGHTYNLFPEFISFNFQVNSDKWPVFNMAMQAYLNEKFMESGSSNASVYNNLTKEEKVILELKKTSLEALMKSGLSTESDERDPLDVKDVIFVKGSYLFRLLGAHFGQKEMDSFLNDLFDKHLHAVISFDEWNTAFKNHFGQSLDEYIKMWYTSKSLPGILLKDLKSYKVVDGNFVKYQVTFKLSNPEPVDGLVTVGIEQNDPIRNKNRQWWDNQVYSDLSRQIYLPAHSAREVGMVSAIEPVRLSLATYLSQNLPNFLVYTLPGFGETRKVPVFDSIINFPEFTSVVGTEEVVVDDEDDGFSLSQAIDMAFLKSKIHRKKEQKYKYGQLRGWNPPSTWDAILESEFYGKYVHSARYTRGGIGDRKAVWKGVLKQKGFYDVSFYLKKIDVGWDRRKKKNEYDFSVFHDGGIEKITMPIDEMENGWNSLGSFFISADTARVELSNKSTGNVVFADAIKWTKSK